MKRITFKVVFLTAALGMLGAVVLAQTPPNPGMMMQGCAMKVQGAELKVADTTDGISIAITTKSGDAAELRRRAEAMAKMHSGATAKYQEIPDGALLTLTPKDPAQLTEFRVQVRKHAEEMKKGDCTMMQNMMGGKADNAEPKVAEPDHSQHHPE